MQNARTAVFYFQIVDDYELVRQGLKQVFTPYKATVLLIADTAMNGVSLW